jgi:tellurite resistance protein
MVAITLADGEIEEPELETMAQVYAELMAIEPELAELRARAEDTQRQVAGAESAASDPFALLLARLGQQLPELDDNARELILESAFRVACSDGEIEPEEDLQLRALADVLAINEGVLELEIARFQRQMLAKASS